MAKKTKGKLDFNSLAKASNMEEEARQLESHYDNVDYMVLSDAFMHRDSKGTLALKYMEERSKLGKRNPATGKNDPTKPYIWKIKVLKNEDGSEPKPGQLIEWKTQIEIRYMGKKLSTTQMREMVRRGDADKFIKTNAAILDDDCCFECGHTDAAQLLSNNGVYFRTGYPISNFPETFNQGKYHNWRYLEVPPWEDPADKTPWIEKEKSVPGKKGSKNDKLFD